MPDEILSISSRRVCTHTLPRVFGYVHVMTTLINILLASGLGAQDPLGLAMHVRLVLKSNAAEVTKDVLHLGVGVAAGGTAEVVDPLHADEDVVHHGNDDGHTNRVAPDDNNSDDRSLGAVVVLGELVNGVDKVNLLRLRTGEPTWEMLVS